MDLQRQQGWLEQLGLNQPGAGRRSAFRDARAGLRRTALAAMMILVMLGPIMTFGGFSLSEEGAVERQVGYLLVLGLSIYAALPSATRASWLFMPIPLLAAFGWCAISLFWAIDPDTAVRRLVLTMTVATSAFVLVRHSRCSSVLDVLRWTLFGGIAVSYLVVAIDPSIGLHEYRFDTMGSGLPGQWRGIFGHKNFAGAAAALCIILFLFDAAKYKLAMRIGVIVACAYFAVRAESKTGLGMLALAVLGGIVFQQFNSRLRAFLIPAIIIVGSTISIIGAMYAPTIQQNVLDPKAFTGRGLIWSTLLNYWSDHPMGAGFGSFWNIGGYSPIYQYGKGFVTTITVGHSGYLDQLVAVGLIGMLLMVVATMVWPLIVLLRNPDMSRGRAALFTALLVFCIGHNVTETSLFERDAIVSTMLFLTVALIAYHTGTPRRIQRSEGKDRRSAGDDLLSQMRSRARG
jgi:O-antigen ligase